MPVELPSELPNWFQIKETLQQLSSTYDIDQIFVLMVRLQEQKYQKSAPPDLSETPFEELKMFFQALATKEEVHTFSTVIIPTIAIIALELDSLTPPTGVKFCPSQRLRENRLSKKLVACLLACAFLCLFPDSEDCANTLNFDWFFESLLERKSQQGKLRCILHYFKRLSVEWEVMQSCNVSFLRVVVPPESMLSWQGLLKSKRPLCPLKTMSHGYMDEAPGHYLKVIPSEKEVGGGVLHSGCLQEEIMFCIYPELLVSKAFMAELSANEAMLVSGFSRYSQYSGFGATFKFAGDVNEKSNKDEMDNAAVAIDSLTFKQDNIQQYSERETLREINKAYVGFIQPDTDGVKGQSHETWSQEMSQRITQQQQNKRSRPVVTSHWGCGIFGGDPQLKCIIQWLAASQAGCPEVLYYTTSNEALDGLQYIATQIDKRKWRVCQLALCLQHYCERVMKGKERPTALLTYMRSFLKTGAGKKQSDSSCVLL